MNDNNNNNNNKEHRLPSHDVCKLDEPGHKHTIMTYHLTMYISLKKIERKSKRIQNPHGLTMNSLQKATPAFKKCMTNDLLKLLNSCEFGQLYAHQSTAKIYKMHVATCDVRIYPLQPEDFNN
uniref:Uncharacterized protein n=1 Tax=Glossina palpalis gambiensis TaxID=67801 RepID=A0A1B0B0I2_9MUSC